MECGGGNRREGWARAHPSAPTQKGLAKSDTAEENGHIVLYFPDTSGTKAAADKIPSIGVMVEQN